MNIQVGFYFFLNVGVVHSHFSFPICNTYILYNIIQYIDKTSNTQESHKGHSQYVLMMVTFAIKMKPYRDI